MARPTDIGNFGESVWSLLNLDTIVGSDNEAWTTLLFIGAMGQAFQQMDDLAHYDADNGFAPWGKLLDVDAIPEEGIPWFGQFTGTNIDQNRPLSEQRQQLRDRVGWQRGTKATLVFAVQAVLTGTRKVDIIERDTDAYHFDISTYTNETPDQAKVQAVITDNKPAGLQFTYHAIAGSPGSNPVYQNLYVDDASYDETYNEKTTYQQVYDNP